MTTSISEIRKDFPLLMSNDVIYLDTAATSQKPSCVLEAERTFYEKYNANPLRGLYELGEAATEKYATNHSIVLCKNDCKIGKTGWFSLLGKAL